ncbi:MAG: DUF4292 domain-containing protein [Desulfobacteraceae bacterium]|nr:DUF4292 domain-containing protein [Desulfobacteraceae bacterium]
MKYFIYLITVLFVSSCTFLTGWDPVRNAASVEAENLVSALKNKNCNLNTFKGIGKIRQWNKYGSQVIRVAWMGKKPGQLRIAALGISGQPVATISSDGKYLYFISHTENRFNKMRSSDPNLKRIVSIPIKFSDVITMLSGGVPVRDYYYASIARNEFGHVIVLKTRWNRVLEKIYLDNSKTMVYRIEMFASGNNLVYSADFGRIQNVGPYRIPFQMIFSNGNDEGFQLSVNRYWPDVQISPSKFVLSSPKYRQ